MLTLIFDTDQQIVCNLNGTYIFYVITYRCSEKTFLTLEIYFRNRLKVVYE
jgi:hypothetical protein